MTKTHSFSTPYFWLFGKRMSGNMVLSVLSKRLELNEDSHSTSAPKVFYRRPPTPTPSLPTRHTSVHSVPSCPASEHMDRRTLHEEYIFLARRGDNLA
ncbi:hypothetical protein PM082_015450 [Marasmius tenuissimus]|nr:hypothetical protein PM082_015450 [Marasmius tenuissimus]